MDIVVITDVAAIVVVIVVLVLITTCEGNEFRYPHAYQQAQACNQVEKAQEHTLQAQALS